MNVNWQKIGFYAVGGAAGALVGIFIAQFVMDVVATQKRMRMEIEDMEEAEENIEVKEGPVELMKNGWKLKANTKVNYSAAGEKEELEVLISKYKKDNTEVGVDLAAGDLIHEFVSHVEETVTDVDRTKPYPISAEQYMEGFGKKKKITKIYFYQDDEVCTDDQGKVLSKPEKILGTDLINMFGGPSGDPDVAYIRNEKLGQDYHVISIDGSYEGEDMDQSPASRKANERGDD